MSCRIARKDQSCLGSLPSTSLESSHTERSLQDLQKGSAHKVLLKGSRQASKMLQELHARSVPCPVQDFLMEYYARRRSCSRYLRRIPLKCIHKVLHKVSLQDLYKDLCTGSLGVLESQSPTRSGCKSSRQGAHLRFLTTILSVVCFWLGRMCRAAQTSGKQPSFPMSSCVFCFSGAEATP